MNTEKKILLREKLENVVDFSADYHMLRSDAQNILHTLAKENGYRKPKNYPGSLSRAFFFHLLRGVGV